MKYGLYLNISLIIILALTIIVFRKMYTSMKFKIEFLEKSRLSQIENNKELRTKVKNIEKNEKILNLSATNLMNALSFKPLKDGKRYVDVYTLEDGQQIVIIFDEEWTYTIEYFDQQPLCEKEPYIQSRELHCMAFIDGKTFDPILLRPIYKEYNSAVIDPIDCGRYKGRGLGTCVIKSLVKILKEINVTELRASLSTVDYHKKEKLYNFYINRNGFELVRELTENSWGLVIKKIM